MKIIYIVVIFCLCSKVYSQVDPRDAKEFFKNTNYLMAIPEYRNLLKLYRDDAEYNTNLGICYLRTNIDKTMAIPFLEKAYSTGKYDKEVPFYLGQAYMYNYEFDKAVEKFKEYKEKPGDYKDQVDKWIEDCYTAKELMKFPLDVTFQNLGQYVNSKYPDYYPYCSKDEEVIAFTSRRDGRMEFDGYYPSDVWFTGNQDGNFIRAKEGGSINTAYDEQAVGISDDGELLFVYVDRIDDYGDIYKSFKKSPLSYKRLNKFGENVNSKDIEISASMSSDGNTLFFSSNRNADKAQGGFDLYMTRKLPNGEWALPQNLGAVINTPYDEDFPTLSSDGKTLYFSSNGFPGMGGFDIYESTWDPASNTWTPPKNIGYPVNTPEDNKTISFTEDGKSAYISALRPEGMGDLDIYRLTFNNVEKKPAIFQVKIENEGDTLNPYISDAFVTIWANDEIYGEYSANLNNQTYTIILEPGEYLLEIEADGFEFYSEDFEVTAAHIKLSAVDKLIKLNK